MPDEKRFTLEQILQNRGSENLSYILRVHEAMDRIKNYDLKRRTKIFSLRHPLHYYTEKYKYLVLLIMLVTGMAILGKFFVFKINISLAEVIIQNILFVLSVILFSYHSYYSGINKKLSKRSWTISPFIFFKDEHREYSGSTYSGRTLGKIDLENAELIVHHHIGSRTRILALRSVFNSQTYTFVGSWHKPAFKFQNNSQNLPR